MFGAQTAVLVAAASSRKKKKSSKNRGLTTSTGYYGTKVGLKPYVSDLTNAEIARKWAEPQAKEDLLIKHPMMNMIESRIEEAVEAQMPELTRQEKNTISNLSEAELKVIKKKYVPMTPGLNRLKKSWQRTLGKRTGNNSRRELLEFALARELPKRMRDIREDLKYEIKIQELAKLSPQEKMVYEAELDYQAHLKVGNIRATTGPGSTVYTWIDQDELASRMANSGMGWGGKRSSRRLTRRNRK